MLAADESVAPVVFGRPAPTHHILLVDMNAFFAAIEQRCNPALVGKPVLVCGNATNRTVVTAASYEARPYGIESGMPLFQALPRCPHAVVIEADPLKYIDIARGIQAVLLRFSPTVEIYSIDEAFLTIPAHEDPVAAARAIKAAIRAEFLLTCSVGIGPNRLLAKMASGMQKPDGLVWLRAEEVPAHFAALPVKKLPGVGGRLERALHGMGLYTAGQLGRAPTALLVSRFGFVMGNYLHQLGNGIDPTPVHSCFTPPPIRSMGHSYTLAADTHDPDEMRAHLLRLAWAVGRRLRAEGYAGRVVRVMARYSDFTSCVREHRFRDDFDQPLAIYRAALTIIERWDAWARPIRALGVAVADLRTGARQMQLPLENRGTGELENGHDSVRARDARSPLSQFGRGVRAAGVREIKKTGEPENGHGGLPCEAPLCGAKQGEAAVSAATPAPRGLSPGLNPKRMSLGRPLRAGAKQSPRRIQPGRLGPGTDATPASTNPSPIPSPRAGRGDASPPSDPPPNPDPVRPPSRDTFPVTPSPSVPPMRFTGRAPLSGLRTRGNRSAVPPPRNRGGAGGGVAIPPLHSLERGPGGEASVPSPSSGEGGLRSVSEAGRVRTVPPPRNRGGAGGGVAVAGASALPPRPGLNPRAESSISPVGASHHLSPAARGRAQALPRTTPPPNPLPVYGEGGSGRDSQRERALLVALDAICDQYGEKAVMPATLVALKESREGRWSSELGPARNNHKPLGSRRFLLT